MTRAQNTQTFNTATANANQDQQNAQSMYGNAATAAQNLYANPGFSQATQSAIVGAGQDANNAAFDSLAQTAAGRVARSNNSAGYNDLADSLAAQKAQGASNAAEGAQIDIGKAALNDRDQAVKDMAGLYGTSLGGSKDQLGIAADQATANQGFWDTFGGAFGKQLGKGLGTFATPVAG